MKGFTTTITVDQSPAEAFAAINDVRRWWSGEVEGDAAQLGAEFTYRYKDIHRSTQRVTEFVPGKKVVWHVSASRLSFTRDKHEWDDTDIVFEISRKKGKTEIRFTHAGLVPEFECYKACTSGWTSLITGNLSALIATRERQPDVFA